jgi:hypothetical protein
MGDIQGPSKQPKLNVASTPPSQLLRFIATYCYVPRFNQLLSRHGNHGPLFTRRRSVVSPLIRAETPLTYPRAYQHPLRLPRRRIPTSPRFRHVKLLFIKCAARPRSEATLANRSRSSIIRLQRARFRKDHRSSRGEAVSRLRARQRRCHPG